MDGDALTRAAERAGARYALLLEALRGALAQALGQTGLARQQQALLALAYARAEAWLAEEAGAIGEAIPAQGHLAAAAVARDLGLLAPPELPEPVQAHLTQLAAALEAELRVQIERDILAALGMLRETALRDALRARSGAIARRGRGVPAEDAPARLRFEFRDRAGRLWASERHVRTLWRQALVLAWNEAALLLLAEHGLETAVVDHPDPQHGASGTLIGLGEGGDGVEWPDLSPVFHPNTQAFVRAPEARRVTQ